MLLSLWFWSSLEFLMAFYLESRYSNVTIPNTELVFLTHVWNMLEVTEMWALLSQEKQGLH